MIRLLFALLVLLVVVAIGAAFAPASLVADRVASAAGGALRVNEVRGTAWTGQATLAGSDGRWSIPVRWQLAALPLLRGTVRLDLVGADAAPGLRGRLVAHDGVLEAHDVDATLPARAMPLPPGTTASGDVRIVAESVRFAPERHEGTLRLEWPQARIALSGFGPVDLGTATATLAADGTRWRGPLRARGGVVHVDADLSVDAAGTDAVLTIVPQPGAPDLLRQWLGPADAEGAVRLRVSPRFR